MEKASKTKMEFSPGQRLRLPGAKYYPLFVIVIVGIIAYSNTFNVPFIFDDLPNIADSPVIKNFDTLTASIRGSEFIQRRFIGYLTFALNYHFGGLSVKGYHIVNLLIHLTNGILVYVFVILTSGTPVMRRPYPQSKDDARQLRISALFAALLFVSHPVQTQAITYIVQRFASLATLFYLLSLILYIKGRLSVQNDVNENGKDHGPSSCTVLLKIMIYSLSFLFAVCAMLTKEISFTLPLIILVYEFIFFRAGIKKRFLIMAPFLLTLAIIPFSLMLAHSPMEDMLPDLSGIAGLQPKIPRWTYMTTEMRVIVTYMRLLLLPAGQTLDYDYPRYQSLLAPPAFCSFLLLIILFGTAVFLLSGKRFRSRMVRITAFGVLWFFITLSVESSIIPIADVIFEHRLYLPSVGAFLAIGSSFFLLADKIVRKGNVGTRVVVVSLIAIITLMTIATFTRNNAWRDQITLWSDVVRKSPGIARAHYNLGLAYAAKGMTDMAAEQYRTTISLKPDYVDAYNNLGFAYAAKGLQDRAIEQYRITLHLKPDYAKAHNNLGAAFAAKGMTDMAIEQFRTAINLKPDYAEPHFNLGLIYLNLGSRSMARQEFAAGLRIKPEDFRAQKVLTSLSQDKDN